MKHAALINSERHNIAADFTTVIKTCSCTLCFIALGVFGIAQGAAAQQRQPPSAKQSASQTVNRQAAPQVEPKSRTGSISGRVVTEGGQPVPFAIVNVFALGGRMPSVTSTDKDGKFELNELASGAYELRPIVVGYVPVANNAGPSGEPLFYRLGDTVTIIMTRGGVISGRVMNADGEPVVQARVRVERVRDERGRTMRLGSLFRRFWETDDRGEYRAYGLVPGQYLIDAGGNNPYQPEASAFDGESPTYYPATVRDAATLVTVESGGEASGIDIRYRGEPGHTVSGKIVGAADAGRVGINVTLAHWTSGTTEAMIYVQANAEGGFALHGVPDGEYNLTASRPVVGNVYGSERFASPDVRVIVRGGDVSGFVLRLAPLGAVTGRVVFEAKPPAGSTSTPPCEPQQSAALEEAVVTLRLDQNERTAEEGERPIAPAGLTWNSAPKQTGEFTLNNLKPGRYRISVQPPSEDWYVRLIGLRKATTGRLPKSDTTTPISDIALKSGERMAGLTIAIAGGAAKISGHVVAESEGAENRKSPLRLRVYLVPVEVEHAGNSLRYMEAAVNYNDNNSFAISNIAPGRYWLLARPFEENRTGDLFIRPAVWDAAERAKIRREAELASSVVALKPCERITDYTLDYATTKLHEPAKPKNVQRSNP